NDAENMVDNLPIAGLGFAPAFDAIVDGWYASHAARQKDPPLPESLVGTAPNFHRLSFSGQKLTLPADLEPGVLTAALATPFISAVGHLATSWTSAATNAFRITSLDAASATMTGPGGSPISSGAVRFAGSAVPLAASGV